ncbi:T9SS C-terminal target domain-containing protein [Chryseotalea sanaruensis]|uniref:T9SS C-terminal target domain-containing protein n=1 Tax=Chryseotalea sanaruensis TaxID=2482724 RepID=A0A401U505_9BACT|nr:T9SS type A sorting domain-containing protein [Chryseotalea sanaruensis]GCC49920.1 T9SS C-terminal target domain-containing protein [Chryseotalea sanaruensis]
MMSVMCPSSTCSSQHCNLSLLIGTLIFSFLSASAQRGPGGVGNNDGSSNLIYWIDANRQTDVVGVNLTQISDLSGNNVQHAILGNPTVAENFVNQRTAISFNGIDQQILTDIFINAASYPNLTVCAVYRPNIVYAGSVWGDYQSGWEGRYITDNAFNPPRTSNFVGPGFDPVDATHPSTVVPGLFSVENWVISSVVFREDVINGTEVRVNGQLERTFTSNHNPGAFNLFTIGAGGSPNAVFPFWFNGYIAEIIVFNEALDELDLPIIENYLSAKYDIALTSNDLYAGDVSGFDYDVAGIGRIDASTVRLVTQGTGIVSIEATSIDVNEFLFWGHNNDGLSAMETSDIPDGVEARSSRVWFTSEVNSEGDAVDIGNLNIAFQLSNLGSITVSDLVLLIDSDQDGLFSDETPITGAYDLSNNNYQFQNVTSISNGSHFTFGSSNISETPLPVSLLNFKVSIVNADILEFAWTTASELNNDYFEILESKDAFNWQPIIETSATGTSNELNTYVVQYDDRHHNGRTYYKLRQVDFDDTSTDLKIEKVDRDRSDEVALFPNPASSFITIQGDEFDHVEIYDSQMRLIKTTTQDIVQVNDLLEGMYLVYIYFADKILVRKISIQSD